MIQLRGSLEELCLCDSDLDYRNPSIGLPRFPESFLRLTELQKLVLDYHFRIKAIPAGILNLKKLKYLSVISCDLRSLPKELGVPSGLEILDLSCNESLGAAPDDVVFPQELKGLKSLRELLLINCGLRRVLAFVCELSSLEEIRLDYNPGLQVNAQLDDLLECCPHLRVVEMKKDLVFWTPTSLAHLKNFKAKLQKKNPNAKVEF